MRHVTEKALEILMLLYVILLAVAFPLFVRDGYTAMASNKFYFFRTISCLLLVIAPIGLLYRVVEGCCSLFSQKDSVSQTQTFSFSLTDWFVFFYGVVVCLSYFSSNYREKSSFGSAFWGAGGWNMGLATQLALVLIYFCVSRFFHRYEVGIGLLLGASVPIFLLGVCNRFDWYPIPMAGASSGFISTLGNINWYCGYFAVVFPLGVGLYLKAREGWKKRLLAWYVLLGFCTGITQGSDSGFLVMGLLFLVVWCVCLGNTGGAKQFFEVSMLLWLAAWLIRVFRLLFPGQFNYDTDLIYRLTYTSTPLYVMIILVCCYALLSFVDKKGKSLDKLWKSLRFAGLLIFALSVIGYVALVIINTRHPLWTPGLNGQPLFTFNSEYMNGRGTTWQTGIRMFLSFPLWNRLVGIGSDCFAAYAYQSYEDVWMLYEQFGNLILTNAHNEWITVLVNTGLWGCISYGAAFVTLTGRSLLQSVKSRADFRNPLLFACGLSVLCYTVHNMVSFQQIISAPLVFLVMGMAEGMLRSKIPMRTANTALHSSAVIEEE